MTGSNIMDSVTEQIKQFSEEVRSGKCPGFQHPCGNPIPANSTHCGGCANLIDKAIAEE